MQNKVTVDSFTLKELREISRKYKVPGRSKATKKSDLFQLLKLKLGERLEKNLESFDAGDENSTNDMRFDVDTKECNCDVESNESKTNAMNSLTKNFSDITLDCKDNVDCESLIEEFSDMALDCKDKFDYVVVQSKTTEKLFPMTGKGPNYIVNDYVEDMYGDVKNGIETIWAICNYQQGPITFQGCRNSPFDIKYILKDGREVTSESSLLYDEDYFHEDIKELWLKPIVRIDKLGCKHLFKKYSRTYFYSPHGMYCVSGPENIIPFCGELALLSQIWDYVPPFVHEIKQELERLDLPYNNSVIFRNLNVENLDNLKEYVRESSYDDIDDFEESKCIDTPNGLHVLYLRGINLCG